MAERGSRTPASDSTAIDNIRTIISDKNFRTQMRGLDLSDKLRQELSDKGLKGFKRGGKVKKTGPARLHKGERVIKASTAKKLTPAKIAAATRKKKPARKGKK